MRHWFQNQLLGRRTGPTGKRETVMEVLVTILGLLSDTGISVLAEGFPAFVRQQLGWVFMPKENNLHFFVN